MTFLRPGSRQIVERAGILLAGFLTIWLMLSWLVQASEQDQFRELAAKANVFPPNDPNEATGAASAPEEAPDGTDKSSTPPPAQSIADKQLERNVKRSLFVPIPKKKIPLSLVGVLGNEALFAGGKTGIVGAKIDGAEVTAIGPDWVDLLWDGKTVKQWVFGSRPLNGAAAGGPGPRQADPEPAKSPQQWIVPAGWKPPGGLLARIKGLSPPGQQKVLGRILSTEARQIVLEHLKEGYDNGTRD